MSDTVVAVVSSGLGVGVLLWLRWRVRRPPTWSYEASHRRAMRSIR